jgi:hypothetical protein
MPCFTPPSAKFATSLFIAVTRCPTSARPPTRTSTTNHHHLQQKHSRSLSPPSLPGKGIHQEEHIACSALRPRQGTDKAHGRNCHTALPHAAPAASSSSSSSSTYPAAPPQQHVLQLHAVVAHAVVFAVVVRPTGHPQPPAAVCHGPGGRCGRAASSRERGVRACARAGRRAGGAGDSGSGSSSSGPGACARHPDGGCRAMLPSRLLAAGPLAVAASSATASRSGGRKGLQLVSSYCRRAPRASRRRRGPAGAAARQCAQPAARLGPGTRHARPVRQGA